MKKLLFIAALGVAGLVSAKGNVGNVEKVNSKAKKITVIKKENKKFRTRCGTFQASCTSAYTCQDWTDAQFVAWAEQIQNNYCQLSPK